MNISLYLKIVSCGEHSSHAHVRNCFRVLNPKTIMSKFHVFCESKVVPSSDTQGQSVGSEEKTGRKFSSTGERAPGYRLSPNYFQKFKRMPDPDWAQKMLCIIMPNRRTVSPGFFSRVRTRRLLSRSRLVWFMHQRNARSQETFSLT